MRLVKELSEQIEDELDGACDYAKGAIAYHASRPELARLYAKMAKTEMDHAMSLHSVATAAIADAENSGAKPTQEMLDKWKSMHEDMVDKATKVRSYLSML